MLDYISDGYICQALEKITGYLKLSEQLAGVTLLAFSNGATDIITAIVASDNDTDYLAIGSIFGAALFALTVIVSFCIWARPEKVIKNVRDFGFIVFSCKEEIWGEILGFIWLGFWCLW
jgi:sodium/potassium/calcium exchanger 6